ncbi:MAG: ABC transporter ATP-binding protein/permease [Planctomycetes bacterium]|nr:ABC transporter ATP-binding protein/permease [Planctomycetota bacterium]
MSEEKPKKKRPTVSEAWRETRELLVVHKQRLFIGFWLMLASRLAGLVLPATSKLLIDDVIGKQRVDLLWPIAIAGGIATLVQAVTGYGLSQVLGVAAQRAINDMRKDVQRHVGHLPVRYFDSTQTGVLISRIMNDAEGIRNLVGTGVVQLVGGLLSAAIGIGVLFYLNWQLTLMILVVLLLFGVSMAWAFKTLRPLFRERGKIQANITGRLNQTLAGVRVVKAYVAEEHEEGVFVSNVDRLFENIRKSMTGVSMTTAVSTAIVGVIGVVLTLVGGRAILAGEMTLGEFVMYLVFIGLVVGPVVQIASIGTQISEAFAGLDRLREIRRVVREDAQDFERATCPDLKGDFAFDKVGFEYDAGKPVLKDITFRAPAGSTTALVGSSGSGKSTLVSLVMAFNRPLAGRITVDGRELASLKLADYRSHLGVVLQDNFLFDGTIAENVAFSRPDATRAEIEEACRQAHCDDFVSKFEKGYDTIVGERGVKLSGGQRQRVAIARALLARPRILILDEATSSLDSESEAQIQDALALLRKSRTTFVIAHRLSTIRSADQILVLERGEIVERGTHHELLALGGRYKELHDRQYAFEHERFVNPGEELVAPVKSSRP